MTDNKQTPGWEYVEEPSYLSISSMSSFLRCPRKFFYEKCCGLRRVGTPHIALTYGTAIHASAPWALRGMMTKALEEFGKEWGDRDAEGDTARNTGNAVVLLSRFMGSHKDGKAIWSVIPPPETKLELLSPVSQDEIAFAVDVGGPLILQGKIDARGRHRDTGEMFAIEYKTTYRMGSMFQAAFDQNPQVIGYPVVLSLSTGEPCKGTIMEAFHTAKSGLTVWTFVKRASEDHMETFIDTVVSVGKQVQDCLAKRNFPRSFWGCNSYSCHGSIGFNCPFLQLCSVPDWTVLLDFFVIKRHRMFKEVPLGEGDPQ